jgi:hypothetical protein
LTGFDERPDRAALEEDCKTRAMQALRKSGGEEWDADPCEDDLAVLQQPARHDGK